jgi:hypothetical protein
VALVVSVYLGSSGDKVQVQSFETVANVARICSGVSKQALDAFRSKGEILSTSESFLKAILRHYKLQMQGASMQNILHARAKLYYRVGRLMLAWPQHQVKLQQSLASIESKYSEDVLAAGALASKLPAIHDMPEMVVTASADKQGKAGKSAKEATKNEVIRSGPITFTEEGETQGSAQASCSSESHAPRSRQTTNRKLRAMQLPQRAQTTRRQRTWLMMLMRLLARAWPSRQLTTTAASCLS